MRVCLCCFFSTFAQTSANIFQSLTCQLCSAKIREAAKKMCAHAQQQKRKERTKRKKCMPMHVAAVSLGLAYILFIYSI